ncbi:hypothetical protein GWK36_05285 [Caldichromatium japonicum]|uniref:Uncharacterized protein n=1 Tax=Caldichromatium japonicum TaxID=2699430 RepID=A0A6G7VCA9_9GAMM|nr:hypothetical protein [Caldichromatium japonicum]QIK37488.1 hypothetical protein GWK36_05285 [Caldichromatium japonicum]
MTRTPISLCGLLGILAAVLLELGAVQPALAQQTLAEAMAQAIARMMESMGFNANQTPHFPPALVPPGSMGQSLPGMPSTAWQSFQGAITSGTTILEGVWEDNQGGLLIVQGGFYRLYAPCRGSIDGDLKVLGNRLELTNRQEGFSQSFEFALDQGRLALRDQAGQIYVYRRLVLGPFGSAR